MEYVSDKHRIRVEKCNIDKYWWQNDFKVHSKELKPYYNNSDWLGKESLLIMGNPGCHKTGQVMEICKGILSWTSVRYYRATELVYSKDDYIKKACLLIIDNIGFDKDFENSRGCLFDLIDFRLHNYLSTIIITNEKLKFDSAFMDRLNMFTKIIIEGDSTRGKKR